MAFSSNEVWGTFGIQGAILSIANLTPKEHCVLRLAHESLFISEQGFLLRTMAMSMQRAKIPACHPSADGAMALWWTVLGPSILHKYHFSIPRNGGRATAVQPTRSKTQRKTKVAMSLVAMAGHLNKGKQDWPMPTDPAPCGLKSRFGKSQTTATTSAGQTPILWVSQD